MKIIISENKRELGKKAARKGADLIRKAILDRGEANIVLATGASQFEMLNELVKEKVEWSRVRGFHLDEYVGLPTTHPASFHKYLKERFIDIVLPLEFNLINGFNNPIKECARMGKLISRHPVDVAFIGIGENSHLAFNDPPADFETEEAFLIVTPDLVSRRQQMGEGWFPTLEEVPEKAISISIRQIMKSKSIICTVPDARKAKAVKKTVEDSISPEVPASIMRQHPAAWLYLDKDSSSLLS